MLSIAQIEKLKEIYKFKTITFYKPYISKEGRKNLNIKMDSKHRLRLLAAWLVEIKYGRKMLPNETVDHIDEDKTNDSIDNLQILTRKDNIIKAHKNGKYNESLKKILLYVKSDANSKNHSGDKNGSSKISDDKVKYYRQLFCENKISIKEIQKETGMHRRSVENFITGKSYINTGGSTSAIKKPLNEDIILKAMDMIEQKIPFQRISKILNIDRSTLRDRIKKFKINASKGQALII
jgi:hypothetical protein